jgi:hypothetical protein
LSSTAAAIGLLDDLSAEGFNVDIMTLNPQEMLTRTERELLRDLKADERFSERYERVIHGTVSLESFEQNGGNFSVRVTGTLAMSDIQRQVTLYRSEITKTSRASDSQQAISPVPAARSVFCRGTHPTGSLMDTVYHIEDLIAALATPRGRGALAIIRTSGEGCVEGLASRFSRPEALIESEGGRVHHGGILDGDGERIDEVLITVFRNPVSYTGQDSAKFRVMAVRRWWIEFWKFSETPAFGMPRRGSSHSGPSPTARWI